jgi:hypothetical protein
MRYLKVFLSFAAKSSSYADFKDVEITCAIGIVIDIPTINLAMNLEFIAFATDLKNRDFGFRDLKV